MLCEYCRHRDRIDLARNSFPCELANLIRRGGYIPNLTRKGDADGLARFGRDFQEDCSDYEYDGVS